MDTFGIFTVSLFVYRGKRGRRVRLHTAHCTYGECRDVYAQFLEENAHIMQNDLYAIFTPESIIIRAN